MVNKYLSASLVAFTITALLPALASAGQRGQASWYGHEGGNSTANGERYSPGGYTAAHRTLPFGTRVRVTNNRNGRSVIVRINDRGPFTGGRIIDLSEGAAAAIGIKGSGVGNVTIEPLGGGGGRRRSRH
jgi:rare lipoprotein A